jgi:hypothetical protein
MSADEAYNLMKGLFPYKATKYGDTNPFMQRAMDEARDACLKALYDETNSIESEEIFKSAMDALTSLLFSETITPEAFIAEQYIEEIDRERKRLKKFLKPKK